jgi:hypothetical protein
MRAVRLILVVAAIGFGYHLWSERQEHNALRAMMSPSGFLPVPMPPEAETNTVLLFTPLNCPREATQRAIALSDELTRLGIRNLRTSRYPATSFVPSPETLASFKRLNKVMTGEIPIALINGMGKANPSVADVVAEYARTK